MTTSLKAVLSRPGTIELRSIEVAPPPAGWAVVRVRNCGICGSDLHFFRGEFPLGDKIALGHEISGEVVAVGEGESGVSAGERVVIEPLIVCRRCSFCRDGNRQLCADRQLIGTAVDGGLAEHITVPDYTLHRLPIEVPFHVGALAEPLAVCVHGLRLVDLQPSERVLVLGAGAIGLLAVVVAREMGASTIAVSARHPHQEAEARRLGADEVFASDGSELSSYTARQPFDVVVETVGGEGDTLATAITAARPGGRISLLGIFTRPVSIHPVALLLKEVRLVGSITYGSPGGASDFAAAIDILGRRWFDLEPLVTSRVPLREVGSAFKAAMDKSRGTIKVTVEP